MKKFITFCLVLLCTLIEAQTLNNSPDRITSLPGFGKVNDIELSGYLPIGNSEADAKLFYWFVESQRHTADTPLVLWLNGGPGAASMYGFFIETGPYEVTKKLTLKTRKFAWNKQANYLIIDQPAGTGFSYGKKGTFTNEAQAIEQLSYALLAFFAKYPELKSKPLFLAGESYAGKYIPQLALRLLKSKKPVNLKGILIGDGWVNPRIQQSMNADFAYSHGIIDQTTQKKVAVLYRQCALEIDKAQPSTRRANQLCSQIQELIKQESGKYSLANLHTGAEPDDSVMIRYLNQPEVRHALHIDPKVKTYTTFSSTVADVLEVGEQDSVADLYPILLKHGIRIMVYNGMDDAKDSNFMGTDQWLAALKWPEDEFKKAPTCAWRMNREEVGYVKMAGGLTQVKIRHAGHLAPADQPEILLTLLNHFIDGRRFC